MSMFEIILLGLLFMIWLRISPSDITKKDMDRILFRLEEIDRRLADVALHTHDASVAAQDVTDHVAAIRWEVAPGRDPAEIP